MSESVPIVVVVVGGVVVGVVVVWWNCDSVDCMNDPTTADPCFQLVASSCGV